jgi:hypothetical protein
LLDSLSALKNEFNDDPEVLNAIDREIHLGTEWMYDHASDEHERRSGLRSLGDVSSQVNKTQIGRGIFDDIDE